MKGVPGGPQADRADVTGAHAPPTVAVAELPTRRRRIRVPQDPIRAVVLGLCLPLAILVLALASSQPYSPVLLVGMAALMGGIGFAAVRAARPAVSAVPVVVRKQDSMMDVLVSRELARARRLGTSLSVASVSLATSDGRRAGARGGLGQVAGEFAGSLRVTDVVAYTRGGLRLTVVLSDTSADDARRLLRRLESQSLIAGRVRVGVASFPEEAVTYRGLRDLASKREQPLAPRLTQTVGAAAPSRG